MEVNTVKPAPAYIVREFHTNDPRSLDELPDDLRGRAVKLLCRIIEHVQGDAHWMPWSGDANDPEAHDIANLFACGEVVTVTIFDRETKEAVGFFVKPA